MYATFFFLIWCSCTQQGLMQTTSWDLVTPPPIKFYSTDMQVELRCTVGGVATCCSAVSRVWNKGSSQIMSNGVASLPSKYSEKLDAANKQFSLIISNLDKNDVDVVYTCSYGNIPTPKTLTQNESFEYPATLTGSCPMTFIKDEGIVGILYVAMSAPYPSVTAQYGGKNFTSYLNTTITPVTNSPKFYTINSYMKAKNATCGNGEKFTLTVLTGSTPVNICDNVDLCLGEICALRNWGYSEILPAVYIIVCLIVICVTGCSSNMKIVIKMVIVCFIITNIVIIVVVWPVGIKVVNCIQDTDPAFIAMGLLMFVVLGVCYCICKYTGGEKTFLTLFCVILLSVITLGLYCWLKKEEMPEDEDPPDQTELGTNSSSRAGEKGKLNSK